MTNVENTEQTYAGLTAEEAAALLALNPGNGDGETAPEEPEEPEEVWVLVSEDNASHTVH